LISRLSTGWDNGVVADRVTVFLLDDHEIVRRGVRDLLEAEDGVVVGEASTEDEAVLDGRLQDGDGITACREIRSRHPRTACLMLTSFADDEALFQAIMAGAAGYVLKQIRSSDLVDAVRRSPPASSCSIRRSRRVSWSASARARKRTSSSPGCHRRNVRC
jgi:DNA-binding NarL/FixJ family response regulator